MRLPNITFALVLASLLPATAKPETLGSIERFDPAFEKLIAPDTQIELLASGFEWSEGPAWDKENERVLFSDVPTNTIHQWCEKNGLSVYMKPSGFTGPVEYSREPGSNGLTFDSKGRLVLCEHGDRRVSFLTKGGGKRTLADNWQGRRFNSPNDLVVHPNGSVYFTDPPYGLPQGDKDPLREIDFFGVFRIAPDGKVTVMDKTLDRPNGIALSHDGKHAYVAQSHRPAPIVRKYTIKNDGSFDEGTLFFDLTEIHKQDRGGPDGLKLDQAGNVSCSGAKLGSKVGGWASFRRLRAATEAKDCSWGCTPPASAWPGRR